jgi:hypothetical protein
MSQPLVARIRDDLKAGAWDGSSVLSYCTEGTLCTVTSCPTQYLMLPQARQDR